jgi:hypothetical protein
MGRPSEAVPSPSRPTLSLALSTFITRPHSAERHPHCASVLALALPPAKFAPEPFLLAYLFTIPISVPIHCYHYRQLILHSAARSNLGIAAVPILFRHSLTVPVTGKGIITECTRIKQVISSNHLSKVKRKALSIRPGPHIRLLELSCLIRPFCYKCKYESSQMKYDTFSCKAI